MRIEADRGEIASALARTAATISAADGFVADDFTVRERDGHLSCAIGARFGEVGRILLSYPNTLTVPMHELEWADRPAAMELADPAAASKTLTPAQWHLLEDWLILINAVDRVAHVRASTPNYAIADPALRHHLADAGYPAMRAAPTDADIRQSVVAWHSMGAGANPDGTPRWRLIPLKHLVNHDPAGAGQNPVPEHTAVATSATSNADQTFENYGDLDAMQLLMTFGYVDDWAPLVHSVPVDVDSTSLGRVVVRWRAPRNPRAEVARDVPAIKELDGEAQGIELRHLTIRPDNRARVAAYLAMACRSVAGMAADSAAREAEAILDAILDANQTYYGRLDALLAASADPFIPMAEVSLRQQQRLRAMWGT